MMPQEQRHKRRQYFIKKDYQFKFILKFCIVVLVGAFISTGLLFLFSQGTLTSSFDNSRLVIRNTSFAILPAVILTNIITLVLITLSSIVVIMFISHKIAGPMFRFEKDLTDIGKGNLVKKISLREKDQFAEIATSMNNMTMELHNKVLSIESEVERLIESAKKQNAPDIFIEELNHLHQSIHKKFII
ncbi:MAG: hypothetical protein LWX51_00875 [Deltaproteobacteria bacterium]|nr:hypothetical protein [Deltaproteobacteria bacterium]